nr:unnamed protein product [Callosobruchus analis]
MINTSDICEEKLFEAAGTVVSNIQIITIYRSPDSPLSDFLTKLDALLSRIDITKFTIVTGDFNVHFETNCTEARLVSDIFESYGLNKVTNDSTRQKACIDNIFTNFNSTKYSTNILDLNMSDHLAIHLVCEYESKTRSVKKRVVYRPITEVGLFNLYNHIETNLNWDFISDNDADDVFNTFICKIVDACDLCFPLKSKTVNTTCDNHKKVHWFGFELQQMRENLRLLTRLHTEIPGAVSKHDLRQYRNRYRLNLRKHKVAANDQFIKNSGNKSRAIWDVIRNTNPTKRNHSSETLDATTFNNYFSSIAKKLAASIPPVTCDPIKVTEAYATQKDIPTFSFKEVSYSDVRGVMSGLRNSSSRDTYGLNVKVIKTIKNLISIPLTKIINRCITSNIFPDCLKVSRVVPIHKKGSIDDVNNYRPIAIVPIFGKIFEMVLKQQLICHFEANMLLNPNQFGFRSTKSTSMAIHHLTKFIQNCFETRSYAMASFFDLSKAFDCISHSVLIGKLKAYNIDIRSCNLIESYLQKRKQHVTYNQQTSSCSTIEYGIPQGSILGPIIFIVYINDIVICSSDGSDIVLFADDTTSLIESNDFLSLHSRAEENHVKLQEWFYANKLKMNEDKTQSLVFSLRHMEADQKPVKFLGVMLDPKLSWASQAAATAGKISRGNFMLRNLVNNVSVNILLNAYYAYVHSHLSYAILCWGHSPHASSVFSAQRRCIRTIVNLKQEDCCKHAFRDLKILTFPSVYILSCLLYTHTHTDNFTTHNAVHSYSTRNRNNIIIGYNRTQKARDGFNYFAIKLYNKLPFSVKSLGFSNFKGKMKQYLQMKAFYSVDEFLENDFSDL